jgi:hypothetical protein
MGIADTQLADLISLTLNNLPDQEFEVAWNNNDYEFSRIYQTERMVIDGGTNIERKVMLDHTGNARYRRSYDTDTPTVGDVMHTIIVPWTQIGTNYSWDKFEILRNKSARGFIKLMKVRRIEGLWSLADLIEERAWKAPTSATDNLYPFGVPYYLKVKNAAGNVNGTSGFVGATIDFQDASEGTICAGIDSAAEAKWRNYAAVYTEINNTMLKAFRLAFMYTKFKAPLNVNDPQDKRTAQKRVYTDFDTVAQLMDFADQRDDNHSGKDILGNLRVDDAGLATINRLPVVPVNQLNGASYTPIYCIDFAKFIPYVHENYWMDEGGAEPKTDRSQHTTFTVFLDGAHNNLCLNLRTAGFVLHKAS